MNRASAVRRKRASRRSPALELLEHRQLLSDASGLDWTLLDWGAGDWGSADTASLGPVDAGSAPSLSSQPLTDAVRSVITTEPADQSQLDEAVNSLVIHYSTDVGNSGFGNGFDIGLFRVNDDGSMSPVFSESYYPTPTFDPSGQVGTIDLGQPLSAGHYRIVLLAGDLSSYLSWDWMSGEQLWDSTQNQTLADFTVAQRGATLADAVDLGVAGPQVQEAAGALDLGGGQANVQLYRVTLAPGRRWRLGLQLDAQRQGSDLSAALSLFDESGRLLATRDAFSGRPDCPADPYLYAALDPGVYYVGVSGAGNLPGVDGGYDPVRGVEGTTGLNQAGGAFTLNFVADPVAPVRVVGLSFQWGDPLDSSPTGLTLSFSGPIDVNSLIGAGATRSPVLAVDQNGRTWTLTPSGYQESRCQVSFTFDQRLPAGRYRLQLPASGGLTDLAGLAPVAPGWAQGVLGAWIVAPRAVRPAPGDLGVLWPGMAGGIARSDQPAAGASAVYRVVVPLSGWYSLQTIVGQGSLSISRRGGGEVVMVATESLAGLHEYTMNIKAGVYEFTFTARGDGPASVDWVLKSVSVSAESLVSGGVSQSSALSLRMINPISAGAMFPSPSVASPGGNGPATGPVPSADGSGSSTMVPAPESLEFVPGPDSAPAASFVSPLPASLLVSASSGLLGRPSGREAHVSAVGPTVAGGMVALADNSPGLLQGIISHSFGNGTDPTTREEPRATPGESAPPDTETAQGEGTVDRGLDGLGDASARADALALRNADRIAELASAFASWLVPGWGADQAEPAADEAVSDSRLAALAENAGRARRARPAGELQDQHERADLALPTGLILASAAAVRLRQLSKRWWRKVRRSDRDHPSGRTDRREPCPRHFHTRRRGAAAARPASGR